MMKIVASLVILGLCANVAFGTNGVAPVVVSQSGAFSSSVLNSTAVQVVKGTNSTDAANWDSSSTTTVVAGVTSVWFGAGATNDTSYLWALTTASQTSAVTTGAGSCGAAGASGCGYVYTTSSYRKRTINNTIAAWGNDTTEASVVGDVSVATTIMGNSMVSATGLGYLAVLSTGLDTVATPNNQVWITLISGASGTATSTKVTAVADVYATTSTPVLGASCTTTSFTVGNVFYDRGTAAFFYTYSKTVSTTPAAIASDVSSHICNAGTATVANTIYLGAIYANGTVLLTTPISVSAVTSTASVSSLIGGVDNTNAAAYVWIAYKDATTGTVTTYVSKTAISANTTAIGSFSALQKDTTSGTSGATGTYITYTYSPAAVWSSNNSYAVTLSNTTVSVVTPATGSATTTTTYGYVNYFNGTTTGVDTGLTTASTSGSLGGYRAWQLNTGYTVVSGVVAASGTPTPITYTYATYWANGTVNTTAVTAGTLSYGSAQFYEDANGTQWVGWYDQDTAQTSTLIYNAYLAKFQGQLNIPGGASILSAISAFFALFLAAIFVF